MILAVNVPDGDAGKWEKLIEIVYRPRQRQGNDLTLSLTAMRDVAERVGLAVNEETELDRLHPQAATDAAAALKNLAALLERKASEARQP